MYLGEMPIGERLELSAMLDENGAYRQLGEHMLLRKSTIDSVQNETSPTDELLNIWASSGNHDVNELFVLLHRMRHYRAMITIRHLVDETYHHLIKNPRVGHDCCNGLMDAAAAQPQPIPQQQHQNPQQQIPLLMPEIPQIAYQDLVDATNGWNRDRVLGKGGFGTVYQGMWQYTKVAIKRLTPPKHSNRYQSNIELQQLTMELRWLNSRRHDNILPLYAYSMNGEHPCLVYQYMDGGSVATRLRVEIVEHALTWQRRLAIAIDTARGLQFLHGIGPRPLVHGDIKPDNILLDQHDRAIIGDFGLAREGPLRGGDRSVIQLSTVQGTEYYLPDDFKRDHKLSTRVDVYSFGVVLLELGTCRPVCDKETKRKLRDLVEENRDRLELLQESRMRQPDGAQSIGNQIYMYLMQVGLRCAKELRTERPEMVQVYQWLANEPSAASRR